MAMIGIVRHRENALKLKLARENTLERPREITVEIEGDEVETTEPSKEKKSKSKEEKP
jgi:hypothetical protein